MTEPRIPPLDIENLDADASVTERNHRKCCEKLRILNRMRRYDTDSSIEFGRTKNIGSLLVLNGPINTNSQVHYRIFGQNC